MRTDDVLKVFKGLDRKKDITISIDDGQKIWFKSEGSERTLHLIEETSSENCPLPKLQFQVVFRATHKGFLKTLNSIIAVSDNITIAATREGIDMEGKSESGYAHEKWDKWNTDLLELDVKEDSRAIYNIDYIVKMMKATSKLCDNVKFEYANKMPCRMTFNYNDSKFYFYLAPRIEG